MKVLLKEIEGEESAKSKARLLTFKEFCQYVYEPSKRIRDLKLPIDERSELGQIIRKRHK
jgi:hypothetical protein